MNRIILDIPPCPTILTSLMLEMQRPNPSASHISALVSRDVGLAAGVIKFANSPQFGHKASVGSIFEALHVLGFNHALNLVVNQLLRRALSGGQGEALPRFWDSATYSAGICAMLATVVPGSNRDTAYTFGLFHDCGIPVLAQRFPGYWNTLRAANHARDTPFTDFEDTYHTTNHAVVGHLLAHNWGLSETLCQAILFHHDYSALSASHLSGESRTLIAIGLLGDHIADLFLRDEEDEEWSKGRNTLMSDFGLGEAEIDEITDEILHRLAAGSGERTAA